MTTTTCIKALLTCVLLSWLVTIAVVFVVLDVHRTLPSGGGIDARQCAASLAEARSANARLERRVVELESDCARAQREASRLEESERLLRERVSALSSQLARLAAPSSAQSTSTTTSTTTKATNQRPSTKPLSLPNDRASTVATTTTTTTSLARSTTVTTATLDRPTELCGLSAPTCRHDDERFLTYTQGGGFNNQRQSIERAFQVGRPPCRARCARLNFSVDTRAQLARLLNRTLIVRDVWIDQKHNPGISDPE